MNRLGQALTVRPGEGRMAALLIGLMLFTSAGGSIGGNGIEALFFSRFGVQFLPYMYVALGVVTFVTSLAITALLGRVARERLYVILPLALALTLAGERAVLAFDLKWFYPVMWLGMNVTGSLQGLLTWGLAGTACDTRQAKRLFPLFGAGGILGAVVGGLGTRSLVNWLHAENLLLVWAGALLIAFLLGRALTHRARAARATIRRSRRPAASLMKEMQQGYQFVRRSRLMQWMSLAAVLFSVLFFSLALPFSKVATLQFPEADALAGFFGLFQGLSTGAAFLASLFLANRLFARFGIMSTILALPVIYLVGFGVLAGTAVELLPLQVFPVLVVFRFIQSLWLFGIAGTAYQAAFNVIPPERRDQTRAFIDGVPGQAGTVMAGLILVIGEQALQPQHLYFIGLGAAALTAFIIWQAGRAYGGALVDALRAGQPQVFFSEEEPFGGFQRDARAVAAVIAGMADPDPAIRRVSAEILGNLSVPAAMSALVGALNDPDAQVRAASLRALARARASPALLEVAACLADPEPEVRHQAVEALCQLAGYPGGIVRHIRPLLHDPDAAVRAYVAVALLRAGPDSEAYEALRAMATSSDAESRVQALHALGEHGDPASFDRVTAGLGDSRPSVRRAAAAALMRLDAGRSIAPLLRALGDDDRSVREAAAAALGQIGEPALEASVAALSDPALDTGALLALEHLPAHQAAQAIREYARQRLSTALQYHGLWSALAAHGPASGPDGAADGLGLLADSLREKARHHGLNALRAVGLLGDRDSISLATENLRSRDSGQRANALETLESVGDRQIVRPLMRLWEPAEPAAGAGEAARSETFDEQLVRLMQDADAWLRACAALVACGSEAPQVRAALDRLAHSDPDGLVREAAASALRGVSGMDTLATLSLMERILFLRRVPLFADLPPADLKHAATIAEERFYPDGETLAQQGEPGDEMYIVVSGEVRVLVSPGDKPPREIARRQPGECVGEMAIISQEPRIASLVASGAVRVLSIDQKQFEGILRERPEISLAVMRVLCARLKEKEQN